MELGAIPQRTAKRLLFGHSVRILSAMNQVQKSIFATLLCLSMVSVSVQGVQETPTREFGSISGSLARIG